MVLQALGMGDIWDQDVGPDRTAILLLRVDVELLGGIEKNLVVDLFSSSFLAA